MESIIKFLRLHWHDADKDEVTTQESVIPGEKTPAPPGVAPGLSVTVEPIEDEASTAEATEAPDVPDVAPEGSRTPKRTERLAE